MYAEIGKISRFFQTSRRSAGANAVIVLYSPGNARLKSSNRTSAKSLATSFKERPSSGMLKALHTVRIFSSPKIGISNWSLAAAFKEIKISRACAPCCVKPPAAARVILRATIRSASAPQTPRGLLGVILHGPMKQIRQHTPAIPKVHCGCCLSKRSNTVSQPICSIRRIISRTAGSGVCSITSCFVGQVLRYSATAFM